MSQKSLFAKLIAEFKPYICYAASSFPPRHNEDLQQEGCLGLYFACGSYDESKGVPFDAYAKICIKRRMISAYKELCKDDKTLEFDSSLLDGVTADNTQALEAKEFFEGLREALTELECNVLDEYLKDLPYSEIAEKLGITQKQVDNTICRVKRKIKEKYTF